MKAEIFIWPLYLTVSNRERRVASRLKIVVADMALICLSIAVVQFFFFFDTHLTLYSLQQCLLGN